MNFTTKQHKERFNELLQSDNTYREDVERRSLFYILSGNEDLFRKRNHIYDFNDHSIEPDCLNSENVDFSTSSKALIRLGFNLYNSYSDNSMSPVDILYSLDGNNYNLAMNGMAIRFGMSMVVEEEHQPKEVEEDEWDIEM
jgi:hypothetical protein